MKMMEQFLLFHAILLISLFETVTNILNINEKKAMEMENQFSFADIAENIFSRSENVCLMRNKIYESFFPQHTIQNEREREREGIRMLDIKIDAFLKHSHACVCVSSVYLQILNQFILFTFLILSSIVPKWLCLHHDKDDCGIMYEKQN